MDGGEEKAVTRQSNKKKSFLNAATKSKTETQPKTAEVIEVHGKAAVW